MGGEMAYIDNYKKYLDEILTDIEICKETDRRIVFGYTSDLDVLLTYNEEEFNKLEAEKIKSRGTEAGKVRIIRI